MLQPLMHILTNQRIVLASGSPRRKQILQNIGLKFEVVPSTFEENLSKSSFPSPSAYALETSRQKTLDVARKLACDANPPNLIIGADTVLSMDENIYEKPRDKEHALEMLTGFCGRQHVVCSGVTLITLKNGAPNPDMCDEERFDVRQFSENTTVRFGSHSTNTLKVYIETGEPMDKAGGYGIQASGGTLIEGIDGDYFNVMGFPLYQFAKHVCEIYKDQL